MLVGHSYAGLVVRQAADRLPERVRRLVLVDGWAGPAGASLVGLAPEWFGEAVLDCYRSRTIDGPHDVMLTEPERLAAMLRESQ